MGWTLEREQSLASLWADGFSASQIAARIGGSRNSIIGKAHRLGLTSRVTPHHSGSSRAPKDRKSTNATLLNKIRNGRFARSTKAPPSSERADAAGASVLFPPSGAPPQPSLDLALDDLKPGQCRFPYGDAAPFKFCGHQTCDGSYCEPHYHFCHRPPAEPQGKGFVMNLKMSGPRT